MKLLMMAWEAKIDILSVFIVSILKYSPRGFPNKNKKKGILINSSAIKFLTIPGQSRVTTAI